MKDKDFNLYPYDEDEGLSEESIRQSYRGYMSEQKPSRELKEKTLQAMLKLEEKAQKNIPNSHKTNLRVHQADRKAFRRLLYSAAGLVFIVALLLLWKSFSPSLQMDKMQAPEEEVMPLEEEKKEVPQTQAAEVKIAKREASEVEEEMADMALEDAKEAAEEVVPEAAPTAAEMKRAEYKADNSVQDRRSSLFWVILDSLNQLPKAEREYKISINDGLQLEAGEKEIVRRFSSDVVAAWLGKTAEDKREDLESKLEVVINSVTMDETAWNEFSFSIKCLDGVEEHDFVFRWDAKNLRWIEEE